MPHRAAIAALLLALAGCGQAPVAPADPPEENPAPVAEGPRDLMSMEGISLYLTDTEGPAGVARKPRVAVHAEGFEALADGALRLDGVDFHVYGPEGEETLAVQAEGGRFDEIAREAHLEGAVQARAGDLSMQLEDLRWRQPETGEPGVAEAEGPALLEKEGLRLEAVGLRLRPDNGTFELKNVRGNVSLEETTP